MLKLFNKSIGIIGIQHDYILLVTFNAVFYRVKAVDTL
jgi:hypothetical protein